LRRRPALSCQLTVLVALAASTACRGTIDAFGSSPESARTNADDTFAAFQFRFTDAEREPHFDSARMEMAREALIPSHLYADTALWPIVSNGDSSRVMYLHGTRADSRYRFTNGSYAPYPSELGEQRHFLQLRSLGHNDYEWETTVDHAIGPVTPDGIAAAIVATFTGASGLSGDQTHAASVTAFPNTARYLSRLFAIDSLRTVVADDGSTLLTLGIAIRPDSVRASLPAFAAYLDKYAVPTVYRVTVTDHQGARYFDLTGRAGHAVVRLRARTGILVALDDPARSLPDSLLVESDISFKHSFYRIGYTNLVGDFTIERGEHLRAWMFRFRREPSWHFPLAVDKLIRSPLRRPFQGRGIELRLGVRDDIPPQTLSFRTLHLVVNESAIMRWIGRLGASAFSDFSGRVEAEEDRFLARLFAALRADVGRQ
jgi:hypothetical protein